MANDLAIDYNTGDLLVAPNKDLDLRTGGGVVDQRIRVRLRVQYGTWDFNPSLGSRLYDMLRMPDQRALVTAEMTVREALEPMPDIIVQDVIVQLDEADQRKINITITYSMLEVNDEPGDTFTTSTTIGVGE